MDSTQQRLYYIYIVKMQMLYWPFPDVERPEIGWIDQKFSVQQGLSDVR